MRTTDETEQRAERMAKDQTFYAELEEVLVRHICNEVCRVLSLSQHVLHWSLEGWKKRIDGRRRQLDIADRVIETLRIRPIGGVTMTVHNQPMYTTTSATAISQRKCIVCSCGSYINLFTSTGKVWQLHQPVHLDR